MGKYKQLYLQSQIQAQQLIENIRRGNFNPIGVMNFNEVAYTNMLVAEDLALCSNRYQWDNFPSELTSQEIESLFYRYGVLCLFKDRQAGWLFSRFATIGQLNPFGRLDNIQPIDLAGKNYGLKKAVIRRHGFVPPADGNIAVIINDYTADYQDISERPRSVINKASTISNEVEVYRQLYNNILLSIKKAVAFCENEDQRNIVLEEAKTLLSSVTPIGVLVGKNRKSLAGALPEMFNFTNNFDTQNYCQQIEFYDKKRKNFNGIATPDTFEKKERKITAESEFTQLKTDLLLMDGYYTRRNGLELIKKFYPNDEEIQGASVKINPVLDPSLREKPDTEDEKGGDENDD